jgi:hypothetical protein
LFTLMPNRLTPASEPPQIDRPMPFTGITMTPLHRAAVPSLFLHELVDRYRQGFVAWAAE